MQPITKPGGKSRGFVLCITDGKIYPSSAEAARAYNISAATMSNHLCGRKGYRIIHNMQFQRLHTVAPGTRIEMPGGAYMFDGKYHRSAATPVPQLPEPDTFDSNAGMDAIEASIMRQMRDTFKNG